MNDLDTDDPYDDEDPDDCWYCHGNGGFHDCGEDCCPCLYHDGEPEDVDWFVCPECHGRSGL